MQDNNIEFWRKFVAEFFTPNAKKKWCVSFYGNSHQTNGVFPQVCYQEKRLTIDMGKRETFSFGLGWGVGMKKWSQTLVEWTILATI